MSRLPPELGDGLRPTAEQVEGLVQPLPRAWVERLAAGSRPTATELARFRARLETAPDRRAGWQRPALVLAAVCALLVGSWFAAPDGEPFPAQQELPLAGEAVLGPTIRAQGGASLSITRRDSHHQVVAMGPGRATFEVDPDGPATRLVVVAGEVEIEVKGTAFTVDRDGDRVAVLVHRGLVEVRHGGAAELLSAGKTWNTPEPTATAPVLPEAELAGPPTLPEALPTPDPIERHRPAPPVQPSPAPLPVAEPVVAELEPTVDALPLELEPPEAVPAPPTPAEVAEAYAGILDLIELRASAERRVEATARFLAEHGDSPHAEEVRIIGLEARAEATPTPALLEELEAWLAANPYNLSRLRLLAAHARLAHQGLGDCERAVPSYRAVAAEGGGEWRAWAAEGLVRCGRGR